MTGRLFGPLRTDLPGKARGEPPPGQQPDPDVGVGEPRVVAANTMSQQRMSSIPPVMHRPFTATRTGGTVRIERRMGSSVGPLASGPSNRGSVAAVASFRSIPAVNARSPCLPGRTERGHQRVTHLGRDRVECLGPVQGQDSDLAVGFLEQCRTHDTSR